MALANRARGAAAAAATAKPVAPWTLLPALAPLLLLLLVSLGTARAWSTAAISLRAAASRGIDSRARTLLLMSGATPTNPSRLRLVYNRKCPFAQKPYICLEEYYQDSKSFELLEVGLYGSGGKPGWFMDLNPKGEVPILWLPSGRVITGSDAIVDHLASLPGRKPGQPNPLVPPSEAAATKWRGLLGPFLKSARAAIERGDHAGLSSLLYKLNKDGPTPAPYLAGASFSAVDACWLPFMQRLVDNHEDVVREAAPKLHAWYEEASNRRSFKVTKTSGYWWWW